MHAHDVQDLTDTWLNGDDKVAKKHKGKKGKKEEKLVVCAPQGEPTSAHDMQCKEHAADDALTFLEFEISSESEEREQGYSCLDVVCSCYCAPPLCFMGSVETPWACIP